jgi:DoxX-like family
MNQPPCRIDSSPFDQCTEVIMKRWTGLVIGAWVVLFLAFDSAVKLLGLDVAVEGTTRLGYPGDLVVIIGLVELVCLLTYVIPRTAPIGALLLTAYLGGATATQVRVEDPWFLFPVAVGVLIWGALWLRDPRVGALFFGNSTPTFDSLKPQLSPAASPRTSSS